jgi:hypothetical protein
MAITQAMCTLFKKDVMLGDQHLDSDTLHIALYTSSATLDATTDSYIQQLVKLPIRLVVLIPLVALP